MSVKARRRGARHPRGARLPGRDHQPQLGRPRQPAAPPGARRRGRPDLARGAPLRRGVARGPGQPRPGRPASASATARTPTAWAPRPAPRRTPPATRSPTRTAPSTAARVMDRQRSGTRVLRHQRRRRRPLRPVPRLHRGPAPDRRRPDRRRHGQRRRGLPADVGARGGRRAPLVEPPPDWLPGPAGAYS